MALDQSVLSELLDAFRTGEGLDLIKEAAALVCQELIEVELTAQIGADRYERTSSRVNERNGHRPRVLSTKAGNVELAIPKLRKGSFFPSILEPRRRIDQALYAVVMEAYVHGVSTRAVDELVSALGVSSGISRSEVSRICAGLDEVVDSFRERRLDHVAFPYVYLDATYLHVREHHQVTSKAVVIATGVSATGHREILGIDVGERGLLAGPGPRRSAAGHLRPARRASGRHQAVLSGSVPPAVPGPLRPEPAGHDPEGPPAHGVGRLQDRFRPGVR
jgi:putative transposase